MLPFVAILFLAETVKSTPTVSFPLNSQVPPVARVSQPLNFQFSSTTFASTAGNLQYSLSGNPSWLNIDSANRRLWGTPGTSDVGSADFAIVAIDSTGSATMQATLVVSTDSAPQVDANTTEALLQAGNITGPTTLALYPSTSFTVRFPEDIFTTTDRRNLSYYATLSDHTPLPAWIAFSPESLVFSGTTPTPRQSPQTIEILLIASNVVGFSGASIEFSLVVSNHQLIFSQWQETVNITPGTTIKVTDLRSRLTLDGTVIIDSDLEKATAQVPSWLSFDPTSLDISGTAPGNISETKVTVSAIDKYGDVANVTLQFTSSSNLFDGQIRTLNVIPGDSVKFDLKNDISDGESLQVAVDLGDAAQWLKFDQNTMTIHGTVPSSVEPQTIHASIEVTTADRSMSGTETFDIVVKSIFAASSASTTVSRRSTSTASEATTTATEAGDTTHNTNNKSNAVIIAVSVICLVLAIIAFVLAVLFCRRPRRHPRGSDDGLKVTKPDISRPVHYNDWQIEDGALESPRHLGRDLEKGEGTLRHAPEPPPEIPVPSPLKGAHLERSATSELKKPRQSYGSTIGDKDAALLASFNRSGDWSFQAGAGIRTPHLSLKAEDGIPRASHIVEESPTRGRNHRPITVYRNSTGDRYRDGHRSIGIPTRRRVTGLGHGRTSFGSPSRRVSALKSCDSYSSFSTLSTSMLGPAASAFTQPPPGADAIRYSNVDTIRKSVRIVPESPEAEPVALDPRPLDERRQSYIRHRAQNRSPFFSARGGSSSRSSSHRPSIIGAHLESLASASDPCGTSTSGSGTTGTGESRQFPGSLRRKRANRYKTAREYSESSSVEPPKGYARAVMPSPSLRSEADPLSDSLYSETEMGTDNDNGMTMSGMSALSLSIGGEMDLDERDELDYSNGESESSQRQPAAFINPVPEPLKVSKERLSSPNRRQRSSDSCSTDIGSPIMFSSRQRASHLRTPSDRLERDSHGNIIDYLSAGETPTIEQYNYVNVVQRSGAMSQSRRSHIRSSSTLQTPTTPTRSSQATTLRASRVSPTRLSRLSAAVRQQLAAQASGASIINRGHPSRASGGAGGQATLLQQMVSDRGPTVNKANRTPLGTISSSNVNLQNAGMGSATTTGAKSMEGEKGKRPRSVEGHRWSSLRGIQNSSMKEIDERQESPVRGNEAFL